MRCAPGRASTGGTQSIAGPGTAAIIGVVLAALASCHATPGDQRFPTPNRDVAPIVGDSFSTEDARDRLGEAEEVMALTKIVPGMSVADVGAGEGYYTVRLSPIVGRGGRVLAEDIDRQARDSLSDRVQRENLDNVAVKLGAPDNPMLPRGSFDRIFLVHMYHEVTSPYAFLWHLRDGLKPGGLIVVVDSNRPVKHHGIPKGIVKCEFAAVGLALVSSHELAGKDAYAMMFRASGPKPAPQAISVCQAGG